MVTSQTQGQMTMYRIQNWNPRIVAVKVLKVTEHFVTYEGNWNGRPTQQRERREGHFFDTWLAARDHLIELAERKVRSGKFMMDQANGEIGNLKGMVNPS